MMHRIGIGYDIHRFVANRKLFIGGVRVPYHRGLSGHSDADVLIHAICDALLGAMGEEDIGQHFSNSNPKYKNMPSLEFLKKIKMILTKKGFSIGNIDAMVLLEAPKLGVLKERMKSCIAKILDIDEARVSIKATTHEGVGGIGRGEAAAAYAVVLIVDAHGRFL